VIDAQKGGFTLQPWDWDFYSEQVRKAKYDLNDAEVKPYFELNNVLENGVFYAAKEACVEVDGIVVRRQLRGFCGPHFLQRGIAIRLDDAEESGHRSVKELPGLLHGHQHILKGGRRRIVRNRLNLREFFGHARLDGRLIVLILDSVERGRMERQSTRRIKRVRRAEARVGGTSRRENGT